MNFVSTLVMKYLGGKWLEKLLSLIPGNGKKTVIAVVSLIAAVFTAQAAGMPVDVVKIAKWLLENLQGQNVDQILTDPEMETFILAICAIASVIHKILKYLKKSYEL